MQEKIGKFFDLSEAGEILPMIFRYLCQLPIYEKSEEEARYQLPAGARFMIKEEHVEKFVRNLRLLSSEAQHIKFVMHSGKRAAVFEIKEAPEDLIKMNPPADVNVCEYPWTLPEIDLLRLPVDGLILCSQPKIQLYENQSEAQDAARVINQAFRALYGYDLYEGDEEYDCVTGEDVGYVMVKDRKIPFSLDYHRGFHDIYGEYAVRIGTMRQVGKKNTLMPVKPLEEILPPELFKLWMLPDGRSHRSVLFDRFPYDLSMEDN